MSALAERRDLSTEETGWAVRETVAGRAPAVALAGFLAALRVKGETVEELFGVVEALLAAAIPVRVDRPCHDIAGTGGDGTGAMNLSTLAAIVAAGAGCTVVKHGGRAASSQTAGSADLIEALGLPLANSAEPCRGAGAGRFRYLFAPEVNPGLRHAVDARRGLGIPTIFNLAAPLINPARPEHPVIGVADAGRVRMLAETLQRLGRRGLVVHGHDGLDKLTTTDVSEVWIVREDSLQQLVFDPTALGLPRAGPTDLRGATAAENAERARAVLSGRRGPLRDAVVLNAAAVIVAGDVTRTDFETRLEGGIRQAEEAIDRGSAAAVLDDTREDRVRRDRQAGEVSP
ncbi:anthranilate phosphoribosyltransferase [Microlunatus parietis]|uniref:Anthranilate phosphoribosyltransferase n=1 Tax=Microlunatus parietis TaxID=682979 RepID=A0A7Y9IF32_9ACTN|nr:anthranilate phosphoribosyltransferase [Microlunatus parietis]